LKSAIARPRSTRRGAPQTYQQLTQRGLKQQNRPFAAAIGRWIWFIRDPNDIRIEFMGQATETHQGK